MPHLNPAWQVRPRTRRVSDSIQSSVLTTTDGFALHAPARFAMFVVHEQQGALEYEFEQASSQFPVFRVVPRSAGGMRAEQSLAPDAHKDARR